MRGLFTKEALVALALAMLLPTRYRLSGEMGGGEVALFAFGFWLICLALLRASLPLAGVLGRDPVVFSS